MSRWFIAKPQAGQQIEAIPSVLSAELQGHRDEVLEVIIDPDALNAYRISVDELVLVLQRNNRLIPAGNVDLDSGRFAVKVPAVVERAEEVLELPVRSNNEGVVTLRDVGVDRMETAPVTPATGNNTISISVTKRLTLTPLMRWMRFSRWSKRHSRRLVVRMIHRKIRQSSPRGSSRV